MRVITHLLSALALLFGLFQLYLAVTVPGQYWLRSASAVQITQVYSEATYYAVLATAAFALCAALEIAVRPTVSGLDKHLAEVVAQSEENNHLLRMIGKILQLQSQSATSRERS